MLTNQNFFKVNLYNEDTGATLEATEQSLNLFDVGMTFRRTELHGVTIVFTQPLVCAFEAKEFLQLAYDNRGTDALVRVDLFLNYNNSFQLLSQQYVDFSTFKQSDLRRNFPDVLGTAPNYVTVEAELIPFGIEQKFLDRWNDSFTMAQEESTEGNTLTLKNAKPILLKAKPFQLQNKAVIFSGSRQENVIKRPIDNGAPFTIINWSEGVEELPEFEQDYDASLDNYIQEVEFNCVQDVNDITFECEFDFSFNITIQSPNPVLTTLNDATLTVQVSKNGVVDSVLYTQTFTATGGGSIIQMIGDVDASYNDLDNYVVSDRKEVEIIISIDATNSGGGVDSTVNGSFNIDNIFASIKRADTAPDSDLTTFLIEEVLQQGCEVVTDVNNILTSNLYGRVENGYAQDGKGALRWLANGEQIRREPLPKPFQISLNKLISDLDAIDCIGLDFLNNRIRIEERAAFYINDVFHTFDNIAEIQKRFANEVTFRNIEGGYSTFISEDEFSLNDETNQEREWQAPNKNIRQIKTDGTQKTYKAKALNLCASSWTREKQRREPLDDKKKDFDDTNFVECVVFDGVLNRYKTELDEPFTAVSGVFSPSEFPNLRLTPLRNFQRHLEFLFHIFWKNNFAFDLKGWNGNVQASTTANDPNFVIDLTPVKEDNSQPSTLAQPIFNPEIIEFTAPLDLDFLFSFINSDNRYRLIEVSDANDNYQSGWLWDDGLIVNFDANAGFTMDFKLLAKANPPLVPFTLSYKNPYCETVPTVSQPPVSVTPPDPNPPLKVPDFCGVALSAGGGAGIFDFAFNIEYNGWIAFGLEPFAIPDKAEFFIQPRDANGNIIYSALAPTILATTHMNNADPTLDVATNSGLGQNSTNLNNQVFTNPSGKPYLSRSLNDDAAGAGILQNGTDSNIQYVGTAKANPYPAGNRFAEYRAAVGDANAPIPTIGFNGDSVQVVWMPVSVGDLAVLRVSGQGGTQWFGNVFCYQSS